MWQFIHAEKPFAKQEQSKNTLQNETYAIFLAALVALTLIPVSQSLIKS